MKTPNRDAYDFLSELCHPNYLGLNTARKINGFEVSFDIEKYLDPGTIDDFSTHIRPSIYLLLQLFDECFDLIKANETMPILEK